MAAAGLDSGGPRRAGDAIVLQMLRPVKADAHVYRVDSIIRLGDEVKK